MRANAKKLHHFVPRFYLRAWAAKEKISCLQDGKISRPNIRNVGAENYFYKLQELSAGDIDFLRAAVIKDSPDSLKALVEGLGSGTIKQRIEPHIGAHARCEILSVGLKNCKTDAAVWAVNPLWLNGKTVNRYALVEPSLDPIAGAFMVDAVHASIEGHKEDGSARLLSIAVRPPWVSMRMFAQRSLFTLHGSQNIPIEQYPFVRRNSPLCRIVIPVKQREDFLVGLRSCGVTETTIYPDLDGLAKELITEYGGLDVPK
jgi:hypothetical protein